MPLESPRMVGAVGQHYQNRLLVPSRVRVCIHAQSQSCPTICSSSGSSVHGISQARILERVTI